ncbi:MAG: topoisomerase IV [Ruminococcaceae bacterium]|nr:topoisomerase IV [Oscillospiraceae bacterium]
MAKKKKTPIVEEAPPAPVLYQPITETIEKNYMPYVMSVIISRAIPEIDGFKPAHRKLLYTMYKMGLMTGGRTKSANIVGATMRLNPHGDAAIYETMVRLTRDNEALLHPFVDSKGSFGKQYSSNMKYAAPRYTEAKLEGFCSELFSGIDKNAVDMVDNYDGTMKEPVLFPTTFPNVLVTPNLGIAVGMASNICSFNLAEVCDGAIAMLKKPSVSTERLMELIKAPDFPGGGTLIYNQAQMLSIFETGQGSVKVRARYSYDKEQNCIDILQIPYSTSIEQIMDKISDLVKSGQIREITDFRDEIDLSGFKLTLDLKRGVDPDKLMTKLYKLTPLEDSFKCNFNVLIDSTPRQMGVKEILKEWIDFRNKCVRRELEFDLQKKKDKLHLLEALAKVLLDIDLAINIIRRTEKEEDVIPNLMKGFDIDEIQANYIAEIKLRNLNREYILHRVSEMEGLRNDIANIIDILSDDLKVRALIASQLLEIKKKHGIPRKTQIVGEENIPVFEENEEEENFPVRIMLSRDGYFKKLLVTPRMNPVASEQKLLKETDSVAFFFDATNNDELMIITDKCQAYKTKISSFGPLKSGDNGDFLPTKLGMDDGEKPIFIQIRNDYPENENLIYLFENGKGVRIPVSAYATKGTRRKLTGAYSDSSPIVAVFAEKASKPVDILMISNAERAILIKSSLIPQKATRTSSGVQLLTLKKGQKLREAHVEFESKFENTKGYRKLKIPATGTLLEEKDIDIQQLKI